MARGVEFEAKNMGDIPKGSTPEVPENYNPQEMDTKPKGIPKGKAQAGTSGGGGGVGAASPPEPITSAKPPPRTLAPNLEQLRGQGVGVDSPEVGRRRLLDAAKNILTGGNSPQTNPFTEARQRIVTTGSPAPSTANLSPNARMALGGGTGAAAAGAGLLGVGALPVITAGLGTGLAAYGITNQIIEDVPGLKKGIERVGEAIHGPITEGTEKAPDLNFMDMGAGVPSPAANIKPTAKKDMQTDLTAQAKPTNNVPKTDSPIDESQFRGPTGKGVNYKLDNAGNMVPENLGERSENPYEKELLNTIAEMKWLSGLVIPAKSGIMADTVAQNYEIFERQKKLEKIVNALTPLAQEGMKVDAKGVPAPLHPLVEQEKQANIKYKTAQTEALEDDGEMEEGKKILSDWEKEKRKGRVELLKESPDMTEASLNKELDRRYPEPIRRKYRLQDKGFEHVEAQQTWSGRKRYVDTNTGKEVTFEEKKK